MDNGGDILQLCRLCLVKDDVNIPIFEEQGDIRQIFLKISSCLPVKVSREDKLPKKICDGCSYKLDMLYEFWNTTANAEKQLLSWLGEAGMNAKMADGTISAVAQQIKPVETFVKQEAIDPSDIHTEDNDDDKSYMFQQKFAVEEAGPSATVTSNEEEPPPKRQRRTAAVKAQIAMDPESDDDDDSGEPITKVEDESEESDGDDHEPPFVDVPSTSADDQPGPSGVGKDGVEAPLPEKKLDVHCYLCNTAFDDDAKLQNHLENLEAFLKAFCKHCKSFIRFEECMLHLDITYSCTLCKLILSKHNFLDHKCLHKPSSQELAMARREECGVCEKLFFSSEDIDSHIRETHSSKPRDVCKCCDIAFRNTNAFLKHLASHTNANATEYVSTPSETFPCRWCDVEFKQKKSLLIHERMVHNNGDTKTQKPKKLRKSTKDQATLVSKIIKKMKSGKTKNVCDVCNEHFGSKYTLANHKRSHKPTILNCTKCAKTFRTEVLRDRHLKTHSFSKRK